MGKKLLTSLTQANLVNFLFGLNPLPPSDAVRQQKKIFYRIFSFQYFLNLKNILPLEIYNLII